LSALVSDRPWLEVEHPVENWTRYSADIVGTVHLHVDYTTPVEEVRAEFEQVLAASKLWNGQTAVLQVVDTTERTMVLRALVSADSAPTAWDLRCEVRERLLAWLQEQRPGALPRVRAELEAPAPPATGGAGTRAVVTGPRRSGLAGAQLLSRPRPGFAGLGHGAALLLPGRAVALWIAAGLVPILTSLR
jgi:hypothetical protein